MPFLSKKSKTHYIWPVRGVRAPLPPPPLQTLIYDVVCKQSPTTNTNNKDNPAIFILMSKLPVRWRIKSLSFISASDLNQKVLLFVRRILRNQKSLWRKKTAELSGKTTKEIDVYSISMILKICFTFLIIFFIKYEYSQRINIASYTIIIIYAVSQIKVAR